MTSDQSEKGWQ